MTYLTLQVKLFSPRGGAREVMTPRKNTTLRVSLRPQTTPTITKMYIVACKISKTSHRGGHTVPILLPLGAPAIHASLGALWLLHHLPFPRKKYIWIDTNAVNIMLFLVQELRDAVNISSRTFIAPRSMLLQHQSSTGQKWQSKCKNFALATESKVLTNQ